MAAETKHKPGLWPAGIWTLLRTDRWLLASAACFLSLLPCYLLLAEHRRTWLTLVGVPMVFLGLAVATSWRAAATTRRSAEKKFWRLLCSALLCWWLAVLVYAISGSASIWGDLLGDLLYAGFYGLLIVAIETRPHRRSEVARLEQRLMAPAAGFFVVGWLIYFPVVKAAADLGAEESTLPSLMLFMVLDVYLAGRLVQLAYRPTGGWRPIYLVLAMGATGFLAGDLWTLTKSWFDLPWRWSEPANALYALPILMLIAAARLASYGPARAAAQPARLPAPISRPLPTVLWALSFPTLHGLLGGAFASTDRLPGGLSAAGEGPREVVVMVMLATLGAYALLQRHLLMKHSLVLWRERRQIETELKESEDDLLLMVHREHQRGAMERHEQTYKKAFQASPDGLLLTDWQTGRVIDVNRSLADLIGRPREQMIGRLTTELGLWPAGQDRQKWLQRTLIRSSTRLPAAEIKDVEGRSHRVDLTFEKIDTHRGRLLLTMQRLPRGGEAREWMTTLAAAEVLVESAGGELIQPKGERGEGGRIFQGPAGRLIVSTGQKP